MTDHYGLLKNSSDNDCIREACICALVTSAIALVLVLGYCVLTYTLDVRV
jgi:hypothetical protein